MSELIDWLYNLPEVKGKSDKILIDKKNKISRLAGGWITSKLMGLLTENNKTLTDLKFSPENFAELIALIYTNRINSTNALKILLIMVNSGSDMDPTHVMEEQGLGQVSDEKQISQVVEEVILSHPKQFEDYKNGKIAVLKFLIGMVMKATEGSADPMVVEKILIEKIKEPI